MWSGETHTRRVANSLTDTVVFYTDQGMRNGKPLASLINPAAPAAPRLGAGDVYFDLDNAADPARIAAPDFATSGTKNHIPTGMTVASTRPIMVPGTYAGAPGTYLCTAPVDGGNCTSSPAAGGA